MCAGSARIAAANAPHWTRDASRPALLTRVAPDSRVGGLARTADRQDGAIVGGALRWSFATSSRERRGNMTANVHYALPSAIGAYCCKPNDRATPRPAVRTGNDSTPRRRHAFLDLVRRRAGFAALAPLVKPGGTRENSIRALPSARRRPPGHPPAADRDHPMTPPEARPSPTPHVLDRARSHFTVDVSTVAAKPTIRTVRQLYAATDTLETAQVEVVAPLRPCDRDCEPENLTVGVVILPSHDPDLVRRTRVRRRRCWGRGGRRAGSGPGRSWSP